MTSTATAVLVAASSGGGGAERVLAVAAGVLAERLDGEVAVVVPDPEGWLVDALRERAIPIDVRRARPIAAPTGGTARAGRRLADQVHAGIRLGGEWRDRPPRLVYSATALTWVGAIAARRAHVPHLWHLHERIGDGIEVVAPWAAPAFYRRIGRLGGTIAVPSRHLAAALAPWLGVDPFVVGAPPVLPAPAVTGTGGLVGFVGAVRAGKGIAAFIEVARRLLEADARLRFRVAGAGHPPEVARWRAEAADLPIEWVGEVADPFRDLDLLVAPPRHETFGLAVLEAMARGIPVVAAPVGALPETCADGPCWVDASDPAAVAGACRRLLDDPSAKRARVAAGRRAAARFTAHRFAARLGTAVDAALA